LGFSKQREFFNCSCAKQYKASSPTLTVPHYLSRCGAAHQLALAPSPLELLSPASFNRQLPSWGSADEKYISHGKCLNASPLQVLIAGSNAVLNLFTQGIIEL